MDACFFGLFFFYFQGRQAGRQVGSQTGRQAIVQLRGRGKKKLWAPLKKKKNVRKWRKEPHNEGATVFAASFLCTCGQDGGSIIPSLTKTRRLRCDT